MFPDDTNIFSSSKNSTDLQTVMNKELKLVFKYCAINKLSINIKITNYMIITLAQRKKVDIDIHILNVYRIYQSFLPHHPDPVSFPEVGEVRKSTC